MRLADTRDGLEVTFGDRLVGVLARMRSGLVAFQYDAAWLEEGFSINSYSLPLSSEVFVPEWQPFDGLFGAFHDSLPDGWGALLLDRVLRAEGSAPSDVDQLGRLAIVGDSGRGALAYRPQSEFRQAEMPTDLDELSRWCQEILAGKPVDDLDAVYAAGGSSGGVRPKAYFQDGEGSWLVKFPSSLDPEGIGAIEYAYALAAADCGIEMPEVRLFPSKVCEGYFGVRRFDLLPDGTRKHMLSASAIVEVSHRVPSLDYESLLQISLFLGGGQDEARRLFRLMCFNVFAHNRDDHSNNFTWICDGGVWSLSPAYDLTYSDGMGGEHATSVLGSGKPGMDELLSLAREVGLPVSWSRRTAKQIRERCLDLLEEVGMAVDRV